MQVLRDTSCPLRAGADDERLLAAPLGAVRELSGVQHFTP